MEGTTLVITVEGEDMNKFTGETKVFNCCHRFGCSTKLENTFLNYIIFSLQDGSGQNKSITSLSVR